MNPLISLPQSNLETLRSGLAHGSLKYEISHGSLIQNGAPPDVANAILSHVEEHHQSAETIIAIIDTIISSRNHHAEELSQTLVVTGPEASHSVNLKTESR